MDIDHKICYNILKSLEFLFVKITGRKAHLPQKFQNPLVTYQ